MSVTMRGRSPAAGDACVRSHLLRGLPEGAQKCFVCHRPVRRLPPLDFITFRCGGCGGIADHVGTRINQIHILPWLQAHVQAHHAHLPTLPHHPRWGHCHRLQCHSHPLRRRPAQARHTRLPVQPQAVRRTQALQVAAKAHQENAGAGGALLTHHARKGRATSARFVCMCIHGRHRAGARRLESVSPVGGGDRWHEAPGARDSIGNLHVYWRMCGSQAAAYLDLR